EQPLGRVGSGGAQRMDPPPPRARSDNGSPVAGPRDVLVNVQGVGERRKPGGGLEPIPVACRLTVLEITAGQHGDGPVGHQTRQRSSTQVRISSSSPAVAGRSTVNVERRTSHTAPAAAYHAASKPAAVLASTAACAR